MRGNGTTTSYAYDAETFRLTHVVTARGGSKPLQSLHYEHNPVGNIVQVANGVPSATARSLPMGFTATTRSIG